MSLSCLAPHWFSGYDIALESFFAIISLAVALFAIKAYRSTNQKQTRLFAASFTFIALSYAAQALFNFLAISEATESPCSVIELRSAIVLDTLGVLTSISLMTIGLSILTYMTLKTERKRTLWLILLISFLALWMSRNTLSTYFIMSSTYLAVIAWHFIDNYRKHKNSKTLTVALAFTFLLIGNAHMIFSSNNTTFYALSHILHFAAYALILWNFYLVLKK